MKQVYSVRQVAAPGGLHLDRRVLRPGPARRRGPARGGVERPLSGLRKWTNGVSTNGVTASLLFFDRGTFWVLPLTYFG